MLIGDRKDFGTEATIEIKDHRCGFVSGTHTKFGEDRGQMALHRALCEEKTGRDLSIRESEDDHPENLFLARR